MLRESIDFHRFIAVDQCHVGFWRVRNRNWLWKQHYVVSDVVGSCDYWLHVIGFMWKFTEISRNVHRNSFILHGSSQMFRCHNMAGVSGYSWNVTKCLRILCDSVGGVSRNSYNYPECKGISHKIRKHFVEIHWLAELWIFVAGICNVFSVCHYVSKIFEDIPRIS